MAYQKAIGKKTHIFPRERHHDAARLRQRALHHHAGLRHRGGVFFLPDESIIMVKTQGENWENMMIFGILWWNMMVNYDEHPLWLWWIMMNYGELLYSALVRQSLKLSSSASLRGSDKSTRLDRMHHHFPPSPAIIRPSLTGVSWANGLYGFWMFLIREVWLAILEVARVMIIPLDREIPDISKPLLQICRLAHTL